MVIDETAKKFLNGDVISNGHFFNISRAPLMTRDEVLVRASEGKRVLHVGCADHPELIEKKRANNRYLHDKLKIVSESLVGSDPNEKAIAMMRELGIGDLYTPESIPENSRFDVVLVPDVIEHVPDVGVFLSGLKEINAEKFVFTTPNAFRLQNRRLYRSELVNTDHRYWFSPYTLIKTLYGSGYCIEKIYYTDSVSVRHPVDSLRKLLFPLCRDGLVVVCSKND